jgi:hypothetical protein
MIVRAIGMPHSFGWPLFDLMILFFWLENHQTERKVHQNIMASCT